MFERFMEKAPQLDEAEEYYDSEEYEYDDYEEEAPVSKIRAVLSPKRCLVLPPAGRPTSPTLQRSLTSSVRTCP